MRSSTTMKSNVKQLKGDGLRVTMDLNDLNLKVLGDGCRVTVARNCGSIRVIGDGCSLKVNCNDGDIEYKGDGGSIYLGGGSRTESVSYVGDGGRISVKGDKSSEGNNNAHQVKRSGKKKSHDNNNKDNVNVKSCSRGSVSDSELEIKMDNASNEIKEARQKELGINKSTSKESRNEERNLRRSKTIVVTKISSIEQMPVNINNSSIKNWFRTPPLVIRNFNKSSGPESF